VGQKVAGDNDSVRASQTGHSVDIAHSLQKSLNRFGPRSSDLAASSSHRRPASVILIRPTAIALPVSLCAVASPARTSLASIWRVKPWTCMIASVAPNGLQASNRSARRCSPPRRRFRGLTVIVCDIVASREKPRRLERGKSDCALGIVGGPVAVDLTPSEKGRSRHETASGASSAASGTSTAGEAISCMGGASKERERASYGDHLVKIGLPPLSSTTVNPAATPTVDRSASCGEPSWRMMNLVAGSAPSASRARAASQNGVVERFTTERPSTLPSNSLVDLGSNRRSDHPHSRMARRRGQWWLQVRSSCEPVALEDGEGNAAIRVARRFT
jgi:hypothetical protein